MVSVPHRPVDDASAEARHIEEAKRGDVKAFEWLYRRYAAGVHGTCHRLVGRAEDAEDFTQRTFEKAWRGLRGFRGESGFGGWLRRIAVNLVIDERRARWREELSTTSEEHDVADPAPRRASDAAIDLERAIRRLPAGPRRVLLLHDVEGLTHREMAERLGVSVGTTKTQLFRARRALEEWLR